MGEFEQYAETHNISKTACQEIVTSRMYLHDNDVRISRVSGIEIY